METDYLTGSYTKDLLKEFLGKECVVKFKGFGRVVVYVGTLVKILDDGKIALYHKGDLSFVSISDIITVSLRQKKEEGEGKNEGTH